MLNHLMAPDHYAQNYASIIRICLLLFADFCIVTYGCRLVLICTSTNSHYSKVFLPKGIMINPKFIHVLWNGTGQHSIVASTTVVSGRIKIGKDVGAKW